MDAWAIGVEKALTIVVSGMEAANGATVQLGIDRLHTRAEMSEELGATFPNSFAESVQEGVAKAWRKRVDQASKSGEVAVVQPLMQDHAWILSIVSKQDEWSKICVEESVRLMASSAARGYEHLSAIRDMTIDDCLSTASGFFTALSACDRLSRVADVDEEALRAVGEMLLMWGVDAKTPGAWSKVGGLAALYADPAQQGGTWPGTAGIRAATIDRAIGAATAEQEEPQQPAQAERARPQPRR